MGSKLLRLPQVLDRVPVSKSTWWNGIKSGKFPAGRKLTERTTVWDSAEIDAVVDGTFIGKGV